MTLEKVSAMSIFVNLEFILTWGVVLLNSCHIYSASMQRNIIMSALRSHYLCIALMLQHFLGCS